MLNNVFHCPLCDYHGELHTFRGRIHAQCPNCLSLERHRFQFQALKHRLDLQKMNNMSALHFAPESCMRTYFKSHFGCYNTADLMMNDVDYNVDIQALPFSDESFDFIFASHVLEHIPDDIKALSEIYRILKPNGMAILPVPIIGQHTVEFDEPDPLQDYHVRAPGVDYYDRYKMIFSSVEMVSSFDVDEDIQPFIYSKDKFSIRDDGWVHPYLVEGRKYIDCLPICYR